MHRIMADLMSKDYEVVTRPSEENYCMHVPDGATGNASRAGMLGTFGRIYHNHRCTAKLANSGSFLRHIEYNESLPATSPELYQQGAKFTVEPDSIQDYAGADVVDAVNPMGGELPWVIGRYRTVRTPGATGGGNYKWTNQPKIATLEHAADFNASYGYKAIMVFCEGTTGTSTWNIVFSIMANKRRDASAPDTSWPYVWQEPFEPTTTPNSMASSFASTVVKAIDLVEFDDGSLFLVVASDKTNILYVECFRSFDYGVNWHYVGDVITPTSQTNVYLHSVAIERINERLVVAYCYSYSSGPNRFTIGTVYYSDDFGQQWTAASDNFSFNYAVAQNSVANCVELVRGRDQVLYLGYIRDTLANANGTPYIRFRRTMDGDNLSSEVDSGLLGKSFGFFEDSAGVWQMYYREWNVGAAGDGELTVAFNLSDPNTAAWTADAQQHFLTMNSIETTTSIWDHVAVAPIDNCLFIDVLGVFLSSSNVAFKTTLNEFKVQMWSGLTSYEEMDYTWHACRNPSTSDSEPNIHVYTRSANGTYTTTLTWDGTELRSYLRLTRDAGGANYIYYYMQPAVDFRTTGAEIRTMLRVNSGQAIIYLNANDGAANLVSVRVVFDADTDKIHIYDVNGAGDKTVYSFTPTNFSVTEWNTYHILFIDDEIHVYRATEQFEELLPFEITGTFDGLTVAGATVDAIGFGLVNLAADYDANSSVDFASFSYCSSISWAAGDMPIDQDTDLLGKRCYFYPLGLYGGMSAKFDGTFGVAGDSWTVETGAIYEMENIFNPSPSICWKSSAYVKGVAHGTEPNEVMTWKQADDYAGEDVRQTVQGFAVFGRNWPFCKLEGSNDGSSFDTLFDSYATQTLAYLLKFTVNGNAVDNRVVVTIPAGMPPLHVNRFASTPEIKYYLMATTGDVRYYVYEILENDATSFYLRGNVNGDIANAATVVVFSDRFYYDFSVRDVVNHADGDIYGDTTFTGYQYEYYRLTVYGLVTEAGPSYRNIVFPDSDDGLKRIGSVHLGRVYDLPHEEWEISCGLQPMMSVTESKTGRKEYRRIGVAKRMIGLNYTGLMERGFGINPVVDLNRALGWGENPLVFVDDADVLQYGDAAPSTFGSYTHQNPVLARMIDGYQMSRVAFAYESENQGDETMLITRDIVNVSGIKLEEVI